MYREKLLLICFMSAKIFNVISFFDALAFVAKPRTVEKRGQGVKIQGPQLEGAGKSLSQYKLVIIAKPPVLQIYISMPLKFHDRTLEINSQPSSFWLDPTQYTPGPGLALNGLAAINQMPGAQLKGCG